MPPAARTGCRGHRTELIDAAAGLLPACEVIIPERSILVGAIFPDTVHVSVHEGGVVRCAIGCIILEVEALVTGLIGSSFAVIGGYSYAARM